MFARSSFCLHIALAMLSGRALKSGRDQAARAEADSWLVRKTGISAFACKASHTGRGKSPGESHRRIRAEGCFAKPVAWGRLPSESHATMARQSGRAFMNWDARAGGV